MDYIFLLIIGFIISFIFFRILFMETKNNIEKSICFLMELFFLYNYFTIWNEFNIEHSWLKDVLYYFIIPIITYILNNKLKDKN